MHWRLLAALLLPALALAAAGESLRSDEWTDAYDLHFRKYAKHYFGPNLDWRWFKAQGIAESGLRPAARSHRGARGIMQILPSTFAEIRKANPHFVSVDDTRWNIAAGIYYDRYMYRRWSQGLTRHERLAFAFASYNAGYGRVRSAYEKARRGRTVRGWQQVAPHTPRATRDYVVRIRTLMGHEPRS